MKILHKLHPHNVHNLFRIVTFTAIQSNGEKLCQLWSSNAQPCIPQWQTTILTAFFQLSQSPGKVAARYDHLKSRPVWSGHHYLIRCDPDQDLGLLRPKQHRPHTRLTARHYHPLSCDEMLNLTQHKLLRLYLSKTMRWNI